MGRCRPTARVREIETQSQLRSRQMNGAEITPDSELLRTVSSPFPHARAIMIESSGEPGEIRRKRPPRGPRAEKRNRTARAKAETVYINPPAPLSEISLFSEISLDRGGWGVYWVGHAGGDQRGLES